MTKDSNVISKKIIIRTRGIDCVCHVWYPPSPATSTAIITNGIQHKRQQRSQQQKKNVDYGSSHSYSKPRGVVIIFHGLGGHAQFPTVKYLAILLAKHSFIVYGMDLPGHGESPGVRGFIASAENLIEDGMSVTLFVKKMHCHLPLFLAGGSMGGTIALAVTHKLYTSGYNTSAGGDMLTGIILMAPMISLPDDVPKCLSCILSLLAKLCPKLALFPPASPENMDDDDYNDDCDQADGSLKLQFRDKERRLEVKNDKLSYKGSLRVGSACSCWNLMKVVQKSFSTLSVPFLLQLGTEDVIVDNDIAKSNLMEQQIPSNDKTLIEYDALHGLLCEEFHVRTQIEKDILKWLSCRTIISPPVSPKRNAKQKI